MKRHIFKLCSFLLLGAIVNVAVAWVFVAAPVEDTPYDGLTPDEVALWNRYAPKNYAQRPDETLVSCKNIAFEWSKMYADNNDGEDNHQEFAATEYGTFLWAGWPAKSLFGYHFICQRNNVIEDEVSHGILSLRGLNTAGRVHWYPAQPLCRGFLVDTIFYAALLWMLFAAPFHFRRHRRIKRGLCPACGYPIGSNEVCTECGAPLPVPPL